MLIEPASTISVDLLQGTAVKLIFFFHGDSDTRGSRRSTPVESLQIGFLKPYGASADKCRLSLDMASAVDYIGLNGGGEKPGLSTISTCYWRGRRTGLQKGTAPDSSYRHGSCIPWRSRPSVRRHLKATRSTAGPVTRQDAVSGAE